METPMCEKGYLMRIMGVHYTDLLTMHQRKIPYFLILYHKHKSI